MADIHIRRDHQLGLAKARKIAWSWAEEVESRFEMECTVIERDDSDTVEFKRTGVSGTLHVAADHFDLQARLGFLLGAFSKTIEGEITRNLDALLSRGAAQPPAAPRTTAFAGAQPVAKKAARKKTKGSE